MAVGSDQWLSCQRVIDPDPVHCHFSPPPLFPTLCIYTSAEMVKESDREYRGRLASGLTVCQARLLDPMQWAHATELSDLAGAFPFPHVIENI